MSKPQMRSIHFSLCRPLIKLSISWRKNGVLVSSGLSDFNRRLTILSPVVSDAGFYECEAILRSSSVPSVSAGAYLHVLGKKLPKKSLQMKPSVCVFASSKGRGRNPILDVFILYVCFITSAKEVTLLPEFISVCLIVT